MDRSGLKGINRHAGDTVTETDAKAVFDPATHPDTGTPLGRPHGQPTAVVNKTDPPTTRHAVVSDLTHLQRAEVRSRAVGAQPPKQYKTASSGPITEAAAATPIGLNRTRHPHPRRPERRVAHVGIDGRHRRWVSTTGNHAPATRNPHPPGHRQPRPAHHRRRLGHLADSRTLYRAAVAASEHYNGLLFDASTRHRQRRRDSRPAVNTCNPTQQLTGIDEEPARRILRTAPVSST